MFTKSTISPRRISAGLLTLLLVCATFGTRAEAQAAAPLATGSLATTLVAPTGLGTVFQTAIDSYGDLLVLDYANGALYEYPAGGGAVVTLVAATGIGGYSNPGIAIDSSNNLYIEANYNNCVLRFPYDTTTNTWDGLNTVTPANNTQDICPNAGGGTSPYIFAQYGLTVSGAYPGYFQPWAIAYDSYNNNLVIAGQNAPNYIFSLPVVVSGTTATPGAGMTILDKMGARAQSMVTDKYGNIYFVEEADEATAKPPEAPMPGVYMIPVGSPELTTDAGLVRVDPNLPAVSGVDTDAAGNLYISDSTLGVFLVPNPSGTPNTAAAVLLTPVPANGQVSVDSNRDIIYVPTAQSGSEAIAKVTFTAGLGSTAAGASTAAAVSVLFGFNAAATPASFVIDEAGAAVPDFAIAAGGSCVAGTAYAAQSSCSENVMLSPHAAGNVSAKLLALDASGNVIGSITLQGTGAGSAIQVLPGGESVIGAGLKTPTQVAVDAGGNTYVADPGLGAIEMYPKGYGAVAAATTVGTGLTAPTGVAVDGGGDVFIADSGNVIEVPVGATGLNTAGQITLTSGLGTKLQLAIGNRGNLYIADPDNHQVVKLSSPGGSVGVLAQTVTDITGFNAPSAIAVDASDNLYVADGSNLDEVTPAGVQTTLLSSLSNATGLAVDPSGSVYVAMSGGTLRIPNVGGTLTASAGTMVASDVTDPTSVAVDSAENVYVTDGAAGDIEMVSASASTNFGTLTSTTGMAANNYTVIDAGNVALNITGFTNTPDYIATSTSCVGTAIPIDGTCPVTVTFNPGPGDQGTLAGAVLINSDAADAPVGVNVTGVGAPLAASTTTVKVTNATVDGAPAVITVAATSGTGVAPTGLVTLTITGATLTAPVVVPGTLAGGTVTITPPQLPAGTYTFSVSYQGDRTYGTSTATANVTVAVGVVMLVQPTAAQIQAAAPTFPFLPSSGGGSAQPYDSSAVPFYYNYPVSIVATDSDPLIGQPVYDSTGKLVGENYGTVVYQVVEVSPVAGGSGGGINCYPVPVASNGTAPFPTNCVAIDTSNNAIPDLETTYTVTPMYTPTGTGSADCPQGGTCVVNPNYAAVTGTPITYTVLRNPVVQISSSPSSLTATSGTPATATLTLTSLLGYGFVGGGNTPAAGSVQEPSGALLNNYSLPVQLACDGLPAYATCTFSYPTPDSSDPTSVAVGPTTGSILPGSTTACAANVGCVGPGTVIMTITTNVPTGDTASLRSGDGVITFAGVFGLGLLGFAFGNKKSRRKRLPALLGLLLCCVTLAGMGVISGCSTKQLGTNSSIATPSGTYMVSVTAKEVGSRTVPVSLSNPEGVVYGNENQVSLPFTISVTIQ